MSLQSSAFCWLGRCWAFSTTPPQGWNCKCRPVELQSYHGKTQKYTIPIDDITEVQVYSSLPEAGRIHGLDLEHYWQGSFVMVHDGTVHLCLDPTAGKFLRVETEDGIFWFTGETDEKTEKIAEWIIEEMGQTAD